MAEQTAGTLFSNDPTPGDQLEFLSNKLTYFEDRARYYDDWPRSKSCFLDVLTELRNDIRDLEHSMRGLTAGEYEGE